ncbi:MAG TPA: carboxypeptidase-like regulatory domain-containing protein [Candidatus Angelobacter sp.]|jgi:hypothetical protein|nr:carboxypeptidase-like regulatory domain-containing protein [Candidatus Angelobacter sp.]
MVHLRITHLGRVALFVVLMMASGLAEHKSATLQFVVVKDENGKPVRNAEIVLHAVDKHGKQRSDGLEIKTHEDGKAQISGIPFGKLRVQVIARGLRTFGEDYDINQPSHEITIKMQKPQEQITIYK